MCRIDYTRVSELLASVERIKPMPEATDEERAWYRGTVHGIMQALKLVQPQDPLDNRNGI